MEKVLDYRRAVLARDLLNEGERGYEQLQKRPDLLELLLALSRAQNGADVTMEQLTAQLAERAAEGGEEDAQ